ncbi:hypothetical protein DFR70_12732 [Nocardia tenerifensis]|uniref:Helix-turn-helix protein n=1 Tax=Nocardia tenerifensis TaxID=228006 RepID=A0A318JNS0_9NOCA|nr:hypothetical protein [Nocardia tenerifensis]PXX53421.1 hypothetical protein DFR70_12732 [Nocardia tenerifensis]
MDDDQSGAENEDSKARFGTADKPTTRADVCELATPAETAKYLRTTVGKLANDRHLGVGPRYMKYGRSVRYPWRCLRDFVEENMSGDR